MINWDGRRLLISLGLQTLSRTSVGFLDVRVFFYRSASLNKLGQRTEKIDFQMALISKHLCRERNHLRDLGWLLKTRIRRTPTKSDYFKISGGLPIFGKGETKIRKFGGLPSSEEVRWVVFRRMENKYRTEVQDRVDFRRSENGELKFRVGLQSSDKVEPRFVSGYFPKNETRRSRFVVLLGQDSKNNSKPF
ncbi:unnamed protein product [Rhizophagus irregularis]|nr:unnamed protein product [Rhizophagus irregularis]